MNEADSARWLQLHRKLEAGTITEAETIELQQHTDAWAKQQFVVCPVCGGSFSEFYSRVQSESRGGASIVCSQCGVELFSGCGDRIPHAEHEIDPSIDGEQWLGEFCTWYYPAGCKPCWCGILDRFYYPGEYSCCPGLLALAVEMVSHADHATAAIRFIESHSNTFANSLHSKFRHLYDSEGLRELGQRSVSPDVGRGIERVLADRAT
jgi:hypothetical protein